MTKAGLAKPALQTLFRCLLLTLTLLVSGCVLRFYRADDPYVTRSSERSMALRVETYERVCELVRKRFFDAKFGGRDWNALCEKHRAAALAAKSADDFYREINALLEELKTSHLGAATPREAFERFKNARPRIGIQLHTYDEKWVVEEVDPSSPAEAAGMRPGWVIDKVDGKPAKEAIPLNLQVGVPVTLECFDEKGQAKTIQPGPRELGFWRPPVSKTLDAGVVYLRFDTFNAGSRRWLSEELKRHRAAPGVIIDLRRNHGGELFSLDLVAAEFFPQRVTIGRFVQRTGRSSDEKSFPWASAKYNGRVILLIDDSTYSAAEILSHALSQIGRATLVGRKTGGAVVGARDHTLPDLGSLQIPEIDYVGLDEERLEGKGVLPHVEVPRSLEALREGRDRDLEEALRLLGIPSAIRK